MENSGAEPGIEYILKNRNNWNLASDANLLKYLHSVSTKILNGAQSTILELDSFDNDLNNLNTEVININSKLLALSDSQFLENRVKEEQIQNFENTTPEEEKKVDEKDTSVKLKQALDNGIHLLNTHYRVIQVAGSDSDSEMEDETGEVLLKPNNSYQDRKLPYLIGTEYFMNDDQVGLGSSSAEETDDDENGVEDYGDDKRSTEFVPPKESMKNGISISLSESESEDSISTSDNGRNQSAEANDFRNNRLPVEVVLAKQLKEKINNVPSPLSSTTIYSPAPHVGDIFSPPPLNTKDDDNNDTEESDDWNSSENIEKDPVANSSTSSDNQTCSKRLPDSLWSSNSPLYSHGGIDIGGIYDTVPPELPSEEKSSPSTAVKSPSGGFQKPFGDLENDRNNHRASPNDGSINDKDYTTGTKESKKSEQRFISEQKQPFKPAFMDELFRKLNTGSLGKNNNDSNEDGDLQSDSGIFKGVPPPLVNVDDNDADNNANDVGPTYDYEVREESDDIDNDGLFKNVPSSVTNNRKTAVIAQSHQKPVIGRIDDRAVDDVATKSSDYLGGIDVKSKECKQTARADGGTILSAKKKPSFSDLFDDSSSDDDIFSIAKQSSRTKRPNNSNNNNNKLYENNQRRNNGTGLWNDSSEVSSVPTKNVVRSDVGKSEEKPSTLIGRNSFLFEDNSMEDLFSGLGKSKLPVVSEQSADNTSRPKPTDTIIKDVTTTTLSRIETQRNQHRVEEETVDSGKEKSIIGVDHNNAVEEDDNVTKAKRQTAEVSQKKMSPIGKENPSIFQSKSVPPSSPVLQKTQDEHSRSKPIVVNDAPPVDSTLNPVLDTSDEHDGHKPVAIGVSRVPTSNPVVDTQDGHAGSKPKESGASPKHTTPGKLDPNLGININVNALLPNTKRSNVARTEFVTNLNENNFTAKDIDSSLSAQKKGDDLPDIQSSVLSSCVKTRAKLPSKRRPPTRRPHSAIVTVSMDTTIFDDRQQNTLEKKFQDDTYQADVEEDIFSISAATSSKALPSESLKKRPIFCDEDSLRKLQNAETSKNAVIGSVKNYENANNGVSEYRPAIEEAGTLGKVSMAGSAVSAISTTADGKLEREGSISSQSKSNDVKSIGDRTGKNTVTNLSKPPSPILLDKTSSVLTDEKQVSSTDNVAWKKVDNISATPRLIKEVESNPVVVKTTTNGNDRRGKAELMEENTLGKVMQPSRKTSSDDIDKKKSSAVFNFDSLFDDEDGDDDIDDLFKSLSISKAKPAQVAADKSSAVEKEDRKSSIDIIEKKGRKSSSDIFLSHASDDLFSSTKSDSKKNLSTVSASDKGTVKADTRISPNIAASTNPDTKAAFDNGNKETPSSVPSANSTACKMVADPSVKLPSVAVGAAASLFGESLKPNVPSTSSFDDDDDNDLFAGLTSKLQSAANVDSKKIHGDSFAKPVADSRVTSGSRNLFGGAAAKDGDYVLCKEEEDDSLFSIVKASGISEKTEERVVLPSSSSASFLSKDDKISTITATKRIPAEQARKSTGSNIFGDEDDDGDDIFAIGINRNKSKSTFIKSDPKQNRKSIFGNDDEDDEDFDQLFTKKPSRLGTATTNAEGVCKNESSQKQTTKARVVKLHGKSVESNPLLNSATAKKSDSDLFG